MTRPYSNLPTRRYERGGVSWVTLLVVAAVVGAVYLAIMWLPVWVLHYEAKQTVRDYMNQAIKNRDDAQLIEKMCKKLATLDQTVVVDANGIAQKVPTIDVLPTDVVWERDTNSTPPMLHVALEYTREIRYPFLDKVSEWTGTVDLTNDLTIPDWGPAR